MYVLTHVAKHIPFLYETVHTMHIEDLSDISRQTMTEYLNSEHLLGLVGNVRGGAVPWHRGLPDLLGPLMAGSHLVRGLWGDRRGRDRGPRPVLLPCIFHPLEKVRPATYRSVQECAGVCSGV